jgi:type VI secretion system protein ImpH
MKITELNKKLSKSVAKYSFPQAVRICATYLRDYYPDEDSESLYQRFRFRANPSLSFAKSDISSLKFIETSNGINVEVTLNFLSLFGAASPLPSHYCEMVLESLDSDSILKDFLNLFNHHLEKLLYPIWERHRYHIQYETGLNDQFSKYVLSIVGLYSQTQNRNSKLDLKKLLPYVGILSMKQKSAGSLIAVLRHYLEHDELEVLQCMSMHEPIPTWQYSSLGEQNCSLGKNTLIGSSITTRGSKFQVLLKNISFDNLYKYSIHGEKMQEFDELVDLALSEPLEHELCLQIKKDAIEPCELSKHYLGVNCFIGAPNSDENIILSS